MPCKCFLNALLTYYKYVPINAAFEFSIFNFKNKKKKCLVFKVHKKFYGHSQGLTIFELPELTKDRVLKMAYML